MSSGLQGGCSQKRASLADLLLFEENGRLDAFNCIVCLFKKLPEELQAELKGSYWCQTLRSLSCFAPRGRKLPAVSSPSLLQPEPRQWGDGAAYPSTKIPAFFPELWQSNEAITALRQIVSSLGDYTLIIMLLPEGAHTCKPLCKVEVPFL